MLSVKLIVPSWRGVAIVLERLAAEFDAYGCADVARPDLEEIGLGELEIP